LETQKLFICFTRNRIYKCGGSGSGGFNETKVGGPKLTSMLFLLVHVTWEDGNQETGEKKTQLGIFTYKDE
jgi:hypothetical protein